MSTIKLADVRRHTIKSATMKHEYSPRKNRASWELYNEGRVERALTLERIVAEMIEDQTGYECQALRGNQDWDITVNLEDKPVRVEVKSAILKCGQGRSSYSIQNVKPDEFDYMFIVLVTPDEIILKWAAVKDIRKVCRNRTYHCNGYALTVNTNNIPKYYHDLEDFPYSA